MADFSKQWCENNDPDMPHDFDILAEAEKLSPNQYVPFICEGYGFVAIGKGKDGEILLAVYHDEENVKWESYNNIVK